MDNPVFHSPIFPNSNLYRQPELFKEILIPIMKKRYQEKWDGLITDRTFLEDTIVSPPREFHYKSPLVEVKYNTAVSLRFPKKHPLMKGEVTFAYLRTTFEEYFDQLSLPEISLNDLPKDISKQNYIEFWHQYLSNCFGNYYKLYGIMCFEYIRPFRDNLNSDREMVVNIPHLNTLRAKFDCPRLGPYTETAEVTIKVSVLNSYVILPSERYFTIKVKR